MLEETIEARGIRVRHSDFSEMPCTRCHAGTGHALEDRFYRVAEMDDCMQCHRSSINNLDTCETCHVPDADAERREGNTTWRVTHGAGWEQAHGMGDLRTCNACHEPPYCIDAMACRCLIPQTGWSGMVHRWQESATSLRDVPRHGVVYRLSSGRDASPDGLPPVHGPEAEDIGEDACHRCHDARYCSECHLQSSHPNVPGVGMGHEELNEEIFDIQDRLGAGLGSITDRIPTILADPRAYPREAMILAAIVGLCSSHDRAAGDRHVDSLLPRGSERDSG